MANVYGDFYSIDIDEACVVWVVNIHSNNISDCQDLPNFGVIGSPVFNRTIDTIYIIGGNGTFYAISMKDGSTLWSIGDVYDPSLLSNYGSLLLHNSMVYATFASHCDTEDYHGGVWLISTISRRVVNRFLPDYPAVGGGVWGLGGVTLKVDSDPSKSRIFTPVGNSILEPENEKYCESIVELDLNLTVTRSVKPPQDRAYMDDDYGSTALYFNGPDEPRVGGCPSPMLAAARKDGLLSIVRVDTFKNLQNIETGSPDGFEYIQQGAWDPDVGIFVIPNNGASSALNISQGALGFTLNSTCHLNLIWHTAISSRMSSPTIVGPPGGRVAFFGCTYALVILDLVTGAVLLNTYMPGAAVNGPTIVNGLILQPIFQPGALIAYALPGR
jgi:outer membrane protein assembly factor BamB